MRGRAHTGARSRADGHRAAVRPSPARPGRPFPRCLAHLSPAGSSSASPVSCWVLLRLGAVRCFSGKHRQSPPVGGADGGVCWLCRLRPIGERDLVRVMGLFGSPSEAFPGAATGENLPAVARPLGKRRLRQQPRLAQPCAHLWPVRLVTAVRTGSNAWRSGRAVEDGTSRGGPRGQSAGQMRLRLAVPGSHVAGGSGRIRAPGMQATSTSVIQGGGDCWSTGAVGCRLPLHRSEVGTHVTRQMKV